MAQKRIWDNFVVIGEARKSEKTKFVVAAACRDGYRCINIREFYYKKSTDEWKPGRDGINIPLLVPMDRTGEEYIKPGSELVQLILDCMEQLPTLDLLDEANAIYMEVDK